MSLWRHAADLVATMLLLALSVAPACPAIYVDCDNISGQEEGTWEHPFRLISSGMAAAAFGDTVLVMPGTYAEEIWVDMHNPSEMNRTAVVMKDGVSLVALAGADSTTIHGLSMEAVVYFDSCGPQTVLRDFTLTGSGTGWGLRRSVLCWQSSPTIEGNAMPAPYSGVYATDGSTPILLRNCVERGIAFVSGSGGSVVENTIDGGVWINCYSEPCLPLLVEDNEIYSSSARWEDAGVTVSWGTSGDVLIVNNTIRDKKVGALLCFGELQGNRFLNNGVNVKLQSYCVPRGDILAEMNWWGTAVPEEIAAKIVDCMDDPALPGCVDYVPWCMDENCTQSPVEARTWSSIKRMYAPGD